MFVFWLSFPALVAAPTTEWKECFANRQLSISNKNKQYFNIKFTVLYCHLEEHVKVIFHSVHKCAEIYLKIFLMEHLISNITIIFLFAVICTSVRHHEQN